MIYLPYSHNGVSDEDKEDDKGFNEGCNCPLPFFKPSQSLRDRTQEQVQIQLVKPTGMWMIELVFVSACVFSYEGDARGEQQDPNQQILKLFQH